MWMTRQHSGTLYMPALETHGPDSPVVHIMCDAGCEAVPQVPLMYITAWLHKRMKNEYAGNLVFWCAALDAAFAACSSIHHARSNQEQAPSCLCLLQQGACRRYVEWTPSDRLQRLLVNAGARSASSASRLLA